MVPRPTAPMYQVIVSYPLNDYPRLDAQIQSLADRHRLLSVGAGAGMAQRDLVFECGTLHSPTIDFLIQVLKLPETEVAINAIVAVEPPIIS